MRTIAVLVLLALAVPAAGCGGERTRTVTVAGPTPAAGARTLTPQDSARVARARVALGDYCAARSAGGRPDSDAEVAALVVLVTIFSQHPNASFGSSDAPLGLVNVLKSEADGLDDGGCDPKGAKLLRNTVDAVLYQGRR